MKKRRHVVWKTMLMLVLLLGVLVADSGLRLVTTEYELRYVNLPDAFDGFRIVQLSDLHGAEFGRDNARLLRAVAAAEPELIAITGDLADGETDLAAMETLLAGLTAIAPVYYVSGNHEWSEGKLDGLTRIMERLGVRYLRNEYLPLERDGARIILAGVEDPNGPRDMMTPPALCAAVRERYPEDFVLLLGHRNDWPGRYPDLPVDLILCGHAHGGVVRLPGVGGLLGTGGTFFPDYAAGVYDCGSYEMLVSRGLGNSVRVPRVFNNPEVVAITLRGA